MEKMRMKVRKKKTTSYSLHMKGSWFPRLEGKENYKLKMARRPIAQMMLKTKCGWVVLGNKQHLLPSGEEKQKRG